MDILEKWKEFMEKYQPFAIKVILFMALLTSIVINLNIITPQEGWILSAVLFSLLLFSGQIDSVYKRLERQPFQVYAMQGPAYNESMYSFLAHDKSKEVKLLEFSTISIKFGLLREIVSRGYQIKLLLCHPESAPNEHQRQRIQATIDDLLSIRESHKEKGLFEIRCYKQIASLRGRKFGENLISIGWYTYGTQRIEKSDLPGRIKELRRPQEIDGHRNVIINADLSTEEGKTFAAMFDRVFDDLWSTAIPFEEVADVPVQPSNTM